MKIFYSSKFEREYRRLPERVKLLAEEKEKVFRKKSFDPQLKTHKLSGKFKGFWAFWIDDKYRIIFDFAKEGVVWFHSTGDHSIYK